VNCLACDAPTASIEIDVGLGLAHCSACGHTWEVGSAPAAVVASPRASAVDPGPAPEGVERTDRHDGSVELQLSWAHGLPGWVPYLWVLGVLPLLWQPGLVAFAWGLAVAGVWFVATRNRTVVWISPSGVRVQHAPVPIPLGWTGVTSADQLRPLYLQRRSTDGDLQQMLPGSSAGEEGSWSLRSGAHTLLHGWRGQQRIAYVEACIAQITGTPRRSTSAEPGDHPHLLPLLALPSGVAVVVTDDDEVELELPWNARAPRAIHLIWVIIVPMVLVGGLGGLVALGAFVVWAYLAFNRTVVRVGEETVHVEHGPLPVPGYDDMTVVRGQLRHLRVVEHAVEVGSHRVVHHSLESGRTTLLAGWVDRPRVEFVQACLARSTDG